jgi:hypothetical protein
MKTPLKISNLCLMLVIIAFPGSTMLNADNTDITFTLLIEPDTSHLTVSGRANLTSLGGPYIFDFPLTPSGVIDGSTPDDPGGPASVNLRSGPTGNHVNAYQLPHFVNPVSNHSFQFNSFLNTGATIGVWKNLLFLPHNYTSGDELDPSSSWFNYPQGDFHLTAGTTLLSSWGTGNDKTSLWFTVIHFPVIPEPTTLLLALLALAAAPLRVRCG